MKNLLVFLLLLSFNGFAQELKLKKGDKVDITYIPQNIKDILSDEEPNQKRTEALIELFKSEKVKFNKCHDTGIVVGFERCLYVECLFYKVKHDNCDIVEKYKSDTLIKIKEKNAKL